MRKSQGKGILGFLEKRRRRKEEERKGKERNVWNNKSGLLFIHRRVRNYEISKIPLKQITGYYILPSL